MRNLNALSGTEDLRLGLDGFQLPDLYRPEGLRRLNDRFFEQVRHSDPALFQRWETYRQTRGEGLTGPQISELLILLSRQMSAFIGKLFRIENELAALASALTSQAPLFEFKREFVSRRVFKKGAPDRPTAHEYTELRERVRLLLTLGFGKSVQSADPERDYAEVTLTLLELEKLYSGALAKQPEAAARMPELSARWAKLRSDLSSTPEGKASFGATLLPQGDAPEELKAVRGLLALLDRFTYARTLHPEGVHELKDWATHQVPKPVPAADKLVELKYPEPKLPEVIEGLEHHQRPRDGFKLTDSRWNQRQVMDHVDYCVICHEREKDSCSKGFKNKDPIHEGGTYKKNALGIPMTGCPLDERISEAHALKSKGDSVAALAVVMLDNPMCPGTGHRICNDCMKACIFQKQEPVNIPQLETAALTDVIDLPYGFEIYGLLSRWNPLNLRRPYALPYIGRNVMVVGLGPAGYTLSHYLLNEGFAVAGVDGLKVEPFSDELLGRNGHPLKAIRDFRALTSELDERILSGFGGVSEYGITVRWDKNFLTLIHLTLARREAFRIYGGVRFGGTITIEDAWELGFDHIAIAAGSGKPTIIGMKNNLIRGIRKASDFLMALQLQGAFKKDALANLQVQLPALVIGGGLTGVDTATELMAYYPVQVEKLLTRHEKLAAEIGEEAIIARLDAEEKLTYLTFLDHGKVIRKERQRAAAAGEVPNFAPFVRAWGGVALVYRRSLTESPAYRLNHEEVSKALEEGIRVIERMSPVEALEDLNGAVRAIQFERMVTENGRLKGSGQFVELPAKTVCVAAGTAPNITYEREYPQTFLLDENYEYFRSYELIGEGPHFKLAEIEPSEDLGHKTGFFTSYHQNGRFISFYGDNHPTYAGNVVKAMASARDGHPEVARLFAHEVAKMNFLDEREQKERELKKELLFSRLDEAFNATVVQVQRLTPTIVEVVVRAPYAARRFEPGQFYRLQNFESLAPVVDGTRLTMEGLALTGAWVDKEKGLLSLIVLEMGASSRLCAALKPGEAVVVMGPTGTPTEIGKGETVLLAGGGLGNAVLFSIGRALKAAGCRVLYFAGFRQKADLFKQDDIEAATDQVIWSVDSGELIEPRRPQDASFRGNVVQAMVAYAEGKVTSRPVARLTEVDRIIAIGSDRMMKAVKDARGLVLKPYLKPDHHAIGSINSPMQCMMKEICAQCLQKHVDPATGKETMVFSCMNQDQHLDHVDFANLNSRLKANSVVEKQTNLWLERLLRQAPELKRV